MDKQNDFVWKIKLTLKSLLASAFAKKMILYFIMVSSIKYFTLIVP